MEKLLVVVDMQNDFVYGALGNISAQSIVRPLVQYISNFDGDVVYTQDTHQENYLETQEGRKLPVTHCVKDTDGWKLIDELENINFIKGFEKPTFGSLDLQDFLKSSEYKEIHFVGVCTGICVISNAVIAKATLPEAKIVIHKGLCACVNDATHDTALKAMELLQMEVV